jgi:hypothetical protein
VVLGLVEKLAEVGKHMVEDMAGFFVFVTVDTKCEKRRAGETTIFRSCGALYEGSRRSRKTPMSYNDRLFVDLA